ncbi:hypothetical protein CH282_27635 [Rhodococcus sp. 06-418-1B]|nr:AAA family ATPase [Rhodococcus sp. 06-418-1B]OZC75712.1 hypothetical protein CH282_27635 [Rhodococcus sp. 06-418-1B]
MTAVQPDPRTITTKAELTAGLRSVRENSGKTYRELVKLSGALHGTISGWFSGQHLPMDASADMFDRVLRECGVGDADERALWWDAVVRVRPASGKRPDRSRAPYKGLESFEASDAEWFFGRSDVVAELREKVRRVADDGGGVVFVLGASGSGKSSVLRAGLAASLGGAGVNGARVLTGLSGIEAWSTTATTSSDPTDRTDGSVVVLDQVEELWTLAGADRRHAVLAAVQRKVVAGAVVVMGLRADFYQNAVAEDVLRPGLVDNPIVLGRLRPDQLRDAIVEPARKAGIGVDDALLRTLLSEMEPSGTVFAHDQGALPMLSHALLATWSTATGPTMTVDDYFSTGGIPGAVGQSAEAVYSSLDPAQQIAAALVFVRLVNIEDDVLTRRRVDRGELLRGEGTDADVEVVVERFAAARLLTVEEDSVSVTHEVLLTAWDRLRRWIDGDRQWHLVHRRLTDVAVLWDHSGRDSTVLLPASRLDALHDSLAEGDREGDLNVVERDYLAASERRVAHTESQQRRRRRVLEVLTAALAVLTVVAVVSAVVAFSASSDADDRRVEAEAALAGQLAGSAERFRALDPGLSVHLALAAYEIDPATAARSALLDASAVHAPVRLPGVSGETVARVDSTGEVLAAAGADGTVRLWSLGAPARARGTVDIGEPGSALTVAFAPTSRTLAVSGASGTSLWDIADVDSPALLSAVGDDATTAKAMAFAPDGSSLALVSGGGAVSVWNVADPAAPTLAVVPATSVPMNAVAFSPDGSALVTAGKARGLQVWEMPALTTTSFEIPSDGGTYDYLSVTYSPDGRTIAAGTTGRDVARWAVEPGGRLAALAPLTGFTSYVNDVAFDGTGSELAAVSSDNSIKTWDAATGVLRETLPGSTVVMSVDYAPDDSALITAGQDGVTRVWPLPGPVMPGQTDTVFINPTDGSGTRVLAGVGSRGDGLRLWDVTDPDRPIASARPLSPTTADPLTGAAALSWDGSLAAGGTSSGAFQLWDVRAPQNPIALGTPHAAVDSLVGVLVFGRTGDLLAVSPQNTPDVELWDVRDPSRPTRLSGFDVGNNPQVMAFSPDERTLAVPTLNDEVELWNVSDPAAPVKVSTVAGFSGDAQAAAFSPDGRLLAAGSADHTLRLWDVADPTTPRHVAQIVGPREAVYSVAFDPSGTRLVAGVDGQSMWMWDISDPFDPRTFATLTAYGNRVNDAVFTAGGAAVIGGGPEKDLRVWRTDPEDVVERICAGGGSTITREEWDQYLPGSPFRELC